MATVNLQQFHSWKSYRKDMNYILQERMAVAGDDMRI